MNEAGPDRTSTGRTRGSAVALLQIEIWLLILVPSGLVIGPLGGGGSPAWLFGVLLLAFWGVSVLDPESVGIRPCVPLRCALLFMWLVTLVSYVVAHRHLMPATEQNTADIFLLELAAFSGIALLAAEGLRTRDELMRVVRTMVTAVAAMAAIAVLQFRPGFDLTKYIARIPLLTVNGIASGSQVRNGFNRPAGTAIHPIEFAVIVATVLGFAIHLLAYDTERSPRRRWITFGLIALAVPISVSRSGILVAVCVVGMFLIGAAKRLLLPALTIGTTLGALVFMGIPGLAGTLNELIFAGSSDSSISTRTSDYAAVSKYLRESPWIGRGAGTFLPYYRILDNQYLLSAIEIGFFGVLAIIGLFGLPLLLGRDGRRRTDDEADRGLMQAFAAAGLATLVASATYDALSFPMYALMVALWTGLCGGWWTLLRSEQAARSVEASLPDRPSTPRTQRSSDPDPVGTRDPLSMS